MSLTAIIGGTGLERLPAEYSLKSETVDTPFGVAAITRARAGGREIVFLSRHGEDHSLAPHRINYRANIAALVQTGVTRVLATNAVGSLRLDLPPGSLVLLDDFIDFTRQRGLSYFDGLGASDQAQSPIMSTRTSTSTMPAVVHTDFSEPYCPALRAQVEETAAEMDIELLPRGVYLCADGPRFETPAEVRLFGAWGADVVGMTGLPEAIFAREAGLCYAAVAIVTNYAAGLTAEPVEHEQVVARMGRDADRVRELLMEVAGRESHGTQCICRS